MPYSTQIIRMLEKIEPSLREVLIAILEEIERQREETVTKKEFNELKEIVRELAEAQRKTEQKLNELAEAQKKTEQKLNELAEAQKKTEQKLNELAEAQKKTEEELKKLTGEHKKTREIVGGLQHTVGYILEDRAYVGLPKLLERDFKVKIIEPLKREYIELSPGRHIEINILGRARKNGKKLWIIGECKSQLKKKDVDEFLRDLKRVEDVLPGDKIPIVVAYQASPAVRNYLTSKGLKIYFSYQFPL